MIYELSFCVISVEIRYPICNPHTISYHITYIISYHITSHHNIISCHIISHHHIISYHITYITSYHIINHIMSYHHQYKTSLLYDITFFLQLETVCWLKVAQVHLIMDGPRSPQPSSEFPFYPWLIRVVGYCRDLRRPSVRPSRPRYHSTAHNI